MFLTRKSLKKINALTIVYCAMSVVFFSIFVVFKWLRISEDNLLLVFVILPLIMCIIFRMVGRYAEGKGKLINSGNKLIFQELRPDEFVRLYEEKRDCPDNVISKPDFDVLRMLVAAYDAMGDTSNVLNTIEEMLSIAPEKKKMVVKLLKSAALFDRGEIENAELIYSEAINQKMNTMTRMVFDAVTKCDRAIAIGDFTTAEAYTKQTLTQKFPPNTPLSILYAHFHLAKIYCATDRLEEAKEYLKYCVENGGETVLKAEAAERLEKLQ